MIDVSLQDFCNHAVATGRITLADVQALTRDVLPDGIACRDAADMLIALERAVPDADAAFADLLVALVVDFAVWGERPSGYVDRAVAAWLAASLAGGAARRRPVPGSRWRSSARPREAPRR